MGDQQVRSSFFGFAGAELMLHSDLSLVALVRPGMMDQHSALIDYNVSTFRHAVLAIFDLELGQHEGEASGGL